MNKRYLPRKAFFMTYSYLRKKTINMKLSNAYLLGLFALTLTMTGCSSGEEEVETNDEPVCSYSYDAESTEFEWTAFKFADKSGAVPGTFSDIAVESEMSEDPKEVIESISFKINTSSVETQNEDRNKKISEFFLSVILLVKLRFLTSEKGAFVVVPRTGFEPVTYGLEIRCSIQLSYRGMGQI